MQETCIGANASADRASAQHVSGLAPHSRNRTFRPAPRFNTSINFRSSFEFAGDDSFSEASIGVNLQALELAPAIHYSIGTARARAQGEARMSCPRAIDVRFFLLFVSLAVVLGVAVGCDDSSASLAPETTADATPTVTRQRVETVVVRSGALEAKDRTSGVVHAFHKARVTAEIQARVLRRAVESGDRVEAGQVLVELDATRLELEVQHAEATLRAHSNDLRHAQREHDRGEKLVSNNAISTQQRDDLRHNLDSASTARDLARVMRDTSKRNLEDAQIRAPFAGSVDSLAVDVGDYVSQGSAVATVVELSRARVFAGVTAQEAARLTGATVAWVQFTALGGGEVEAELKSVGNVASMRDGTYSVELWVNEPPEGLRDGMVASVRLPIGNHAPLPLAPRAALMRRSGSPEVFVVEHKGEEQIARLRMLRTGRSAGDWIEVHQGLADGDEVIVNGQFALRDGIAIVVDSQSASTR
jgi:membrane fusion protein (multidrug efflux system)